MKQAKTEATRNVVVAITSGAVATTSNPRGDSFREGDIYAADAEIVRRAPRYFLPFPATVAEVHDAQAALKAGR